MRIQLRRGTAAQWAADNPVLAAGEPAIATDTGVLKIGDGVTAYSSLPSIGGTSLSGSTAALGNVAQTMDPLQCTSKLNLANGTFNAQLIYLPGAQISTLTALLYTAGVTPGAGVNRIGLYTLAGNLVDQTGDMTAAFQSATPAEITGALTGGPQTPAAGAYYLALLTSFTGTAPQVGGSLATGNVPAINGRRSSVFLTAQTVMPASFNPATATLNNGSYYMGAR